MSNVINLSDGSLMDEKNCLCKFNGEYVNGKAVIPDDVEDINESVFKDSELEKVCTVYEKGYYLGSKDNPYKYYYKAFAFTPVGNNMHPDTEYICHHAFYWARLGVDELVLPPKIKAIGEGAFRQCKGKKIVVPESCLKIGENAFEADYPPQIVIPNSVVEIAKGAFKKSKSGTPYSHVSASPLILSLVGRNFLFEAFEEYLKNGRTPEEDQKWLPEIAKSKGAFVSNTLKKPNSRDFMIALENKWIKTVDYDKVMDFAVASGDVELKAALLDYSLKPTEKQIEKKETAEFEKAIGLRKLTVSDIKKLWKYRTDDDGNITLTKYIGEESAPYIPISIGKTKATRIATDAFCGCRSIEDVFVPDGIVAIGKSAFSFCSKLKSVVLPKSLMVVGEDLFSGCVSLEQEPDISKVCLGNCDTTAEIEYDYCNLDVLKSEWDFGVYSNPNKCVIKKYLGNQIEIKVPERIFGVPVTEIGMECFSTGQTNSSYGSSEQQKHNRFIESVELPDTVKKICNKAFAGCKSLERINIPQECDIGSYVFLGCEKLASEDSLIIFNDILYQCTDKTSCYSFHPVSQEPLDIVIPNGVKEIHELAFSHCKCVVSVTVPDSVTHIGDSAFFECRNLESVTVERNDVFVGSHAFQWCEKLADDSGLIIVKNNFVGCISGSCKNVVIPEGVTRVCENALNSYFDLETVKLPESLIEIGDRGFAKCPNLKSINIPESVKHIGAYAFENCKNLELVTAPQDDVIIGGGAFNNCEKLADESGLIIVKNILFDMLSNDAENIVIPRGVTSIGDKAFHNFNKIKTVIIPDSVSKIGEKAFLLCLSLETIKIPDSVALIGDKAFGSCSVLTIECSAGSYAETYAKENKIKFEIV